MGGVVILGVFVADTAFRAKRQPRMGETVLGESFSLGPGGKGSNQAVACGRLGAEVAFLTRLGRDAFADMARSVWAEAGVTPVVVETETATGAAAILIDDATGENAIIIAPGAAAEISIADVDAEVERLRAADVFLTQLEQPIEVAAYALRLAHEAGVATILNPAPAAALSDDVLRHCTFITPNESEAEALTGLPVRTEDEARRAAERLRALGAGTVVMTLGAEGALLHGQGVSERVPAFNAGPVVQTTGAGDAFNGGFAAALSRGEDPLCAVRCGCATAGLSVTRAGAAAAMPSAAEVDALLAR
ncbi:MAG: ribokinase [Pseudomonadota bacterium]